MFATPKLISIYLVIGKFKRHPSLAKRVQNYLRFRLETLRFLLLTDLTQHSGVIHEGVSVLWMAFPQCFAVNLDRAVDHFGCLRIPSLALVNRSRVIQQHG